MKRICECTIPKKVNGKEKCYNRASYKVTLTPDFDSEVCYWCEECVELGQDMIAKKRRLTK